MSKLNDLVNGVCVLVNVGCIFTLAAIGLKRNNDAYVAECKCIDLEFENIKNEYEISKLKQEIAKLKKKYEDEEEA